MLFLLLAKTTEWYDATKTERVAVPSSPALPPVPYKLQQSARVLF